jgi:hypothetical protein
MKKLFPFLFLFLLAAAFSSKIQAQNADKPGVKASAELVSSYIWRGVPAYTTDGSRTFLSPNIQPTLALTYKGLEVGAWGSTDFTGAYQEMDLYASWAFKGLTLMVSDYYWDANWASRPYFSYKNEVTPHIFEGSVAYDFQKIPLSISVATMVYGADKKVSEEGTVKNNYSTYVELGYNFKVQDYSFDTFLGMTPADGFYGDGYGKVTGFGVVNLGATGTRTLHISDKYETTVRSSLIFNPQQEKAYLVFGLTF